jgi:hypothetical protein
LSRKAKTVSFNETVEFEWVPYYDRTKDATMIITPVSIDELRSMLIEKVRAIPKENWAHGARYQYLQQLLGRGAISEAKFNEAAEVMPTEDSVTETNEHEYAVAEITSPTSDGSSSDESSSSFDDWIESIGASPIVMGSPRCCSSPR